MEDLKGKIKIRIGNERQEPFVVYVLGWHTNFELWICGILNSTEIVYSESNQLLDFDNTYFDLISLEWKISQQDKIKTKLSTLFNETILNNGLIELPKSEYKAQDGSIKKGIQIGNKFYKPKSE